MARVLISNDGSHSPDSWAVVTAEEIVQVDPDMIGDRLLAAEKLKIAIAEALVKHYSAVQNDERSKLTADVKHILTAHNPQNYMEAVVKDIVATTKDSPWSAHFSKPDVQDVMRGIIASHLQSAQHVERLWHADKNPDSEIAQTYKRSFV